MKMNEKIKFLRQKNGMTLEELGNAVGVGKSTVRKWETGQIANMRRDKIAKLAKALDVTPAYLMGWDDKDSTSNVEPISLAENRAMIPILGKVPAGVPVDAIQDIKGYIDVPVSWVDSHGALIVKGDSMYPDYHDGDVVIYKYTPTCENGDDCIVYVNGDPATIKKVVKKPDGIILQPRNPKYDPMFFERGEGLTIGGIVVEIRRKMR